MFDKIVVPLDGSKETERALGPAVALAQPAGAELLLLRSVVPAAMLVPDLAGEYVWGWAEKAEQEERQAALAYLETIQQEWARPPARLSGRIEVGDEASLIVDTAAGEGVDLIVTSPKSDGGLFHWTLDSVTERVLHSTPCPVLIVRSAEPITKILITLDGSHLAEMALEPGLEVARRLGAHVTLLRVNHPTLHSDESVQMDWVEGRTGGTLARLHDGAQSYLEETARRYAAGGPAGREIKTVVLDGRAADRILHYADEHQIGLIVMATHGRTGLQRWLYGSVTSKVLHNAHRSLLIVRPPADALS